MNNIARTTIFLFMGLLILSPNLKSQEDDFDAPPPGVFSPEEDDNSDAESPADRFERFRRLREENARKEEDTDESPPSGNSSSSSSFGSSGSSSGNSKFSTSKRPTPNLKDQKVNFSNAEPEDITNENFPELIDSFDFPNADIADVVKAISELTGKNFIIDSGLRGKITIIAPTQITVAEAYKAFLSALAMAGFTVVPSGKFLKIRSVRSANRDSIETYSGNYSPDTDQIITRIIHLKHISAEEIYRKLNFLTSKDGEAKAYGPTNSLIVTDYGSRIQTITKMLKQLDVPGFEEQLEVIPIKFAKAKDIAQLIDQIINKGENKKSSSGFTSGIRRFGQNNQESNTGNSAFSTVIPDDRTNAIIVVGNRPGINKIKGLVEKLDFQLNPEEAGGVFVYYMRYGAAKNVADILNGIAKDQTKDTKATSTEERARLFSRNNNNNKNSSEDGQGMFGGDVKISADETINALLITANKQDYEVVKTLLSKIDIPRNQVNVETIIMEISATKKDESGFSIYKFTADSEGKAVAKSGFGGGNISSLFDINQKGGILGFASGEDVEVNINGATQKIKSLMGLLTLLKGVTDVNILSTPHITAMDNVKASIEVGQNVPVASSSTQNGSSTTTNITREPVTIKLEITPRISPGSDSVQMEIQQTIKQIASRQVEAKNLADNAISTTERAVTTQIAVNDGDTAVLGGLIRETEDVNVTKVPLLGDLPIIGWLFKSKSVSKEKANLVMFITPRILRTAGDSKNLVTKRLEERVDFIKKHQNGKDLFGEKAAKLLETGNQFKEVEPVDGELLNEIEPDLDSEKEGFGADSPAEKL